MVATFSCDGSLSGRPLQNGLFNGLIWPKVGCASIAYAATAASKLSSPAGCAVIPREPRKPLLCCQAPAGCAVNRLRPVDRHRGRNGAGSEQSSRRTTMAPIGPFQKTGNHEITGEIITLHVTPKNVPLHTTPTPPLQTHPPTHP